jgi:hypothetical protein
MRSELRLERGNIVEDTFESAGVLEDRVTPKQAVGSGPFCNDFCTDLPSINHTCHPQMASSYPDICPFLAQ